MSVTVIVFASPATGVLCPIAATLNVGNSVANTTKRGFAPFVSPSRGVLGFVIATAAAAAVEGLVPAPPTVATTLTAGDTRAEVGFAKVNVAVIIASLGMPVDPAVSTSSPALVHPPVATRAVVGLDVTVTAKAALVAVVEPASPEIVTVEEVAGRR